MKKAFLLTSSVLLTFSLQGHADSGHSHDDVMKDMHQSAGKPASNPAMNATTEGEVRKVDKSQGKVTLRHADIKNLDMPAMTMVYKVQDPKILNDFVVGDKVAFTAERVNDTVTITMLKKIAK